MISARDYSDGSLTYRVDDQRTAWREVDSEGVVLDLETSVYFGLNRSAGVLWSRLMAGSSYDGLIRALLASSPPPASKGQAAQEISDFLAALDAANLLESEQVG